MDDLISRQDFDKCLEDAEKESVKNRKYVFASALNTIRGNLRNFPSAQPTQTNTPNALESLDCISRQAAIDALKVCITIGRGNGKSVALKIANDYADIVKKRIETLPSAQPEIIRCKDCKNSEHWYRDRRRCFLWSEDGVSVFDDGFCSYAERKE